jgi:lipopolysaccharide export system permease protein
MLILSQIITKEWFKSLFGSLVVLFILITVGDIVNGFLQNYSTQRVFLEYALKLPLLMSKALPIAALVATLFSINHLKSQNELIAILASGYSVKKIYGVLFLCSLSIAFFQFINIGYIMPSANKAKRKYFEKSIRSEGKHLARSQIGGSKFLWYKSENYLASFVAFDRKTSSLKNVSFYFFNQDQKMTTFYRSQSATYLKDGLWELEKPLIVDSLSNEGFPQVTNDQNLTLGLNEKPNDFSQFESDLTTLNIIDLFVFVNRLEQTGLNASEYQVMVYEKISLAVICIVFALFPAYAVSNPNRRMNTLGKNIMFTLVFSVLFWVIYSSVLTLGNSGKIPALVATMGIPMLFILQIAWTYSKNQKL